MEDRKLVGRNTLIKKRTNAYEQESRKKFVEIMNNPRFTYSDCLDYIDTEIKQGKRMARFDYKLRCFKNDGIYQVSQAINKVFGAVNSMEDKSPSGDSDIQTVDICLADGTRTKAPYGKIALQGLGDEAYIDINYDTDEHLLVVTGKCQMRYTSIIDDIMSQANELLKTNSIYKNQALEITDINEPKILDLSNIDSQLMVLSDSTKYALRPIEARLLQPENCVRKGIPLKYGALLEGNYGTGKSLIAFKLAKQAIENGWMFIYLKDPTQLAEVLRMSQVVDKSGWGVVVFVEDVDQVTRGNRDAAMQDILNTLDGGDTKGMNVISLFTTNHIELIEPTFLRGKRIGSIISLGSLDRKTADEFIRRSFEKECYTIHDDLSEVCEMVEKAHIVPAFMAEIIESVKSNMILDNECEVKADYLKYAIKAYEHQVQLAQTKNMSKTVEQTFVEAAQQLFCRDPKNYGAFLKMMEDHCDESVENFK